ncbi:hypothetical protein CH306_18445 [Rhodococcus sp. 15-725-2-2b]|uniref:hypothetical protein n=1 Tax=unclassified Rhodococcus (in: high G+C Gram-positive bacteria) TaxID=192944 RepID=UPI000B9A8E46|nr:MULTISPECIES: hypothetical protein [unclassified Rhodococcus (in: high G+C Gram-positive bacteria)]OZC64647.1 hypothetical protein CH277_18350 [Rhodococcus sp. 06-469-3-2]OZD43465.1 hypothetical protein CH264_17375 [Rhodococcus sp. 06-1477-1A]OZE71142.1 hypothetical protein CH306_18445 [Rhodococcus sp. 15-725-2-2b]
MGYFAVLDSPNAKFTITQCHINIWVLRSLLPGRRLLYFDLGLEISADGSQPVDAVELLLPFKVENGYRGDQFQGCLDLHDTLLHPETAELIFGEPVNISGTSPNHTLRLTSGAEFDLRHVDTANVTAINEPDELHRSSHYRVPLSSPVSPGSKVYVRFRLRVFANRPLLTPRSPFGGVILDFRIADVRESRDRAREVTLRSRIVQINKVNFFAMLPDQYQLLTASPGTHNMRILETRAWSSYLHRVAYMHPANVQLVYYWRSSSGVSPDNPFRVFATYDRHLNKAKIIFWTIIGVLLAAALARSGWVSTITTDNVRSVANFMISVFGLATIAGIIAAVRWLVGVAMNRLEKPRMWVRWLERLVLGRRAGP